MREKNGFLKYICDIPSPNQSSHDIDIITYKCVNSSQIYKKTHYKTFGRNWVTSVDFLCENDPFFYQACEIDADMKSVTQSGKHSYATTTGRTPGDYPCGYFCLNDMGRNKYIPNFIVKNSVTCNDRIDCSNTDLDERFCSGKYNDECNFICKLMSFCEDESFCDGFHYGVRCKSGEYFPLYHVCDGKSQCEGGEDEVNCSSAVDANQAACFNVRSGTLIPIYNFTRCGARVQRTSSMTGFETLSLIKYCEDFMDQTNCSDPKRVGVFCPVQGFMSSVAKQIICLEEAKFLILSKIPQICDDGLEKACVQTSLSCFIHRHFMCDGKTDCQDQSDETHELCWGTMTIKACHRSYVQTQVQEKIQFPLEWVGDGVHDCLDGIDEADSWPTCHFGEKARIIKHNSHCMEVYICLKPIGGFIEYSNLCDKRESCQNENRICDVSRDAIEPIDTAIKDEMGRIRLFYCLDGLENVAFLKEDFCSLMIFQIWKNTFGQNKEYEVIVPHSKNDCRHVYGEYYVFLSCLGLCNESSCPLTRKIWGNSCIGQFESKRIFTKASNGKLTFLMRDPITGTYGNNLFRCKNDKCVTYDKVCNLVDDCGDFSDESSCNNHFHCKKSKEFLVITQICDGVFHCKDMSDECNDICERRIIGSNFLKAMAWIISTLAIILNCKSLYHNISTITKCKSEPALLSNGMIVLISLGDLLLGSYLLVIVILDHYHGASYCWNHSDWISSDSCAALGAVSTTASQISLFSVTALSMLRFSGITNDFCIPKKVSKASIRKLAGIVVAIILLSLSISLGPLSRFLEDSFVNGIRFEASNTLFHGCPTKKVLGAILHEYYGKIMKDGLTWVKIVYLVKGMFSADYGGISYSKQSFYGNDAVCLFKYFVRKDDPQGIFVFVLLCFNFFCSIVIGLSYGKIVIKTKKSAKKCVMSNQVDMKQKEMNTKLQRITFWIIFTDFVCWVPFIVICCFHYLEIVDATPWYSFFSILVLPINSVINPIIYDTPLQTVLLSMVCRMKEKFMKLFNLVCIKLFRRNTVQDNEHQEIELQEIKPSPDAIAVISAHDN